MIDELLVAYDALLEDIPTQNRILLSYGCPEDYDGMLTGFGDGYRFEMSGDGYVDNEGYVDEDGGGEWGGFIHGGLGNGRELDGETGFGNGDDDGCVFGFGNGYDDRSAFGFGYNGNCENPNGRLSTITVNREGSENDR
jgi:hypothetical protein